MRKILSVVGLLLIAALFFTGMVLGSEPREEQREQPAPLPAVGTVRGSDLKALEQAFGCPVPHGKGSGVGQVTDAQIGTLRARLLTWQASDGMITGAVRPAEAAQLLRYDGMTLDNSTLWTLDEYTLLMASGDGAACAYYDDDGAAYSLYLDNSDIEGLLARLSSDVIFPQ